MDKRWEDCLEYAKQWVTTIPIAVPLISEVPYAKKAFEALVVLLYDNPTTCLLPERMRFRSVRRSLKTLALDVDSYGFCGMCAEYKRHFDTFLEGFLAVNSHIFFYARAELTLSPIWPTIATLQNREITVNDLPLIRYIGTWLGYLSKLPLERTDLFDSAKTAWIDRQKQPQVITASRDTLLAMRWLVSELMEGLAFIRAGSHGPGSTAGGYRSVADKNANYRPSAQSLQLIDWHVDQYEYHPSPIELDELIFVKKDAKNLRPITMTPPAMQFSQQAMKFSIYHHVDITKTSWISEFVEFSNQEHSRKAALRGSVVAVDVYKPSTIDLSNASDNLGVDLVIELFSGDLLHYLMCGRSWACYTDPKRTRKVKGKTIEEPRGVTEYAMYGGMGSALTFPVQTIVFTSAALLATVLALYKRTFGVVADCADVLDYYLSRRGEQVDPSLKRAFRSVRVYGDDICVPDFAAEELIKLLSSIGLVVNVNKSFVGESPIRESCGVYALGGWDITPQRFRVPPSSDKGAMDTAEFDSARQHANAAYQSAYKMLYRFLIRYVKNRTAFIAGRDLTRKSRKGKDYPDQAYKSPSLLFEEYRGEDVYIGFVSSRPSETTHVVRAHEAVQCATFFCVAPLQDDDETSEFYHLTKNYRHLEFGTNPQYSHGKVSRGVRLTTRNAYQVKKTLESRIAIWGWVPR